MEKVRFVVGITGGSGVGKTTLIDGLRKEFGEHVSTFSLDNYYLPKDKQQLDENGIINFDLPSALDLEQMQKDFDNLMAGNAIQQEVYNFNNPSNQKEYLTIEPKKLLIVEGLFVMHYEFLRAALNYSVFLSVDPDLQLERRLMRDVKERNYSEKDVLYQWNNHVIPSFESFVKPYMKQVDLVITNNDRFDENIHILTSVIHQNLD
ncbi:AAA family ATPase [Paracrocinitomix mangrovi]|uniref:uridine kinase family protein n=1 Tax=Paracrocinitomix mangrovi TaxID=2862509 RepID=UPI001C8E092C|nr:AAA family ATPase [Paracrocinitomix mangrovi]UKN00628.1 AAA family ATPase [Paracrocinitomix mangrovi]